LHFAENAFCGNHNGGNIVCIKLEQEGCRRLCENTKGGQEPKTVEKHSIRRYGLLLNAAFSKWPPSRINCQPQI